MVHARVPGTKGLENYLAIFGSREKKLLQAEPSWLTHLRKTAIERFSNLGFPTAQNEYWKYTNVAPIAETRFDFVPNQTLPEISIQQLETFMFGHPEWPRLVFVNGKYLESLSSQTSQTDHLRISNLRSVLGSGSKVFESYLARIASFEENSFAALNTALMDDGAFIYIPEGKVLDKPIHLMFVSLTQNGALTSQPRTLIVAGKNSKVRVIESYASLCGGSYFTNAVTEVFVGENASVEHYKLQRESERAFHIGTTEAYQSTGSKLASFSIDLGGKLVRNNLTVGLHEEGSECELNGLYYVSGEEHVDNTTFIDHPKPCGVSRQLYKGLISGKGRAVFFGKVYVHKNAHHTDAAQTNKNLLLSEGATVDTRPQLEILNDDVKCTHGAAVGQLDEEMIFYLKTRGIGDREAERLLSYGFAREVIERVRIEAVRTELDRLLLARLQDCAYFAWRDRMKK
ncbi:MAG: Fe-S cluster assembly protein SufD [Candidatus Omnitrophica bacterium]|nr:Fe-S cluster assembly protein SufD [Candidatus Omnitrophota bacterium]